MSKYCYEEKHCPQELITTKLQTVNPICLDILYKRGFDSAEKMEEFLFPSLMHTLNAYPKLLDTDKAIEILESVVKRSLPTTIYHDYDVDGITAGAIAATCLASAGVPVHCYCNDRIEGGFGISPAGIDDLMSQFPDTKVLITVDNGITGIDGVNRAKDYGLSVIITDHHEPSDHLPNADAVIDNKRNDEPDTQYRDACGAGVIWELMLALFVHLGKSVDPVMDTLDYVALGTIADVVPLKAKNRCYVQEGLQLINAGKRPFFKVLADVMKFQAIDAQTISFQIAPMINAVSRMGADASWAIHLLMETNKDKLREGIVTLDELNRARREETDREVTLVMELLDKSTEKPIIIFKDKSLKEGIVGIVAGQLKEKFSRPAAVFALDKNGNWKGSCRSPKGFHLKKALDMCSDYLLSYGGHAKAAGVTVRSEDFDKFQEMIESIAAKATIEEEKIPIDVVLPASAYTEQFVRELRILEPYGEGFQELVFGLVADITDVRYMGQEHQHVKYIDVTGLPVILWNKGDWAKKRSIFPHKFVGHPQINIWNGNTSVQFIAE